MNLVEGATRVAVDDNELLYRGIVVEENTGFPSQIVFDNNLQKYRLTSAAFLDQEISVDIASKTTPQESLNRLLKSSALACLQAKQPKELGCEVIADPIDNEKEKNPAHALICTKTTTTKSQRKKIARKLAKCCQWTIPPKGFDVYESILT